MSIRTFAASTATIAALSALPAPAVAYPVRDAIAPASTSAAPAAPVVQQSRSDSTGGTGTLVVVGIAGATLLVGLAGGFEGGRVRTRRHSMG